MFAVPEMMTAAAGDLATIGSELSAARTAAATLTTGLIPAAADEVSASVAHLFSQHAQGYQALAGQAAAFQDQFVHNLSASAGSYASIEAAIASFLQNLNANANQVFNSLTQNQVIGDIAVVGILVVGVPILLALYAADALRQYQMTGQILSWSAFLSGLSVLANLYTGGF